MKTILLICLLIALGNQLTVTDSDKCSICTDFKSQADCTNINNGLGCEWKNSACTQTVPLLFLEYCQTIADPATKCAKTFGCAYFDTKCTHFTGCTAYVKTTLSDCQGISNQCITNGVTCDNIQLCKDYTKEMCESNPSPVSPYKCKLENDTCRDLKCTEADNTLISDSACDAWLDGCVTTGYGCIDVLPNCSQYTGTSDTCNKMIGKDGKCTLDASSTSTPQACKLRECSEAALTTWDNISCGSYKAGCKSTGFSCVDSLAVCSAYSGSATTCLNFIGSDGQCAGDTAATTCRTRKCEDKISGVLTDCIGYLLGCKTNGVTCVTSLGNCSSYKGTITTCAKIVGADGFCKGTSATDATVSCALRDCAADDIGTETTDTACQLVQKTCKTTGKGCVASLSSCTTYTDDGNCLKYVGSEGKCKAGAGGASPKCAARACADNTTATTNTDCKNYLPGCVTNETGCVAETNCSDTVSKLTCQGTTNNYTCNWSEICVAKDCTALTNQSLCSNTKLSDSQPCIWKSPSCVLAACSDYISTDNTVCDGYKKGCVSNGTKCADPANCTTEFTGTVTICRAFKAYCTNTDAALATDACTKKTCTDTNITVASDSDCDSYLTGCLFAGTNKCISDQSDCTGYFGTATIDCSKFTGYKNATERSICWFSSAISNTNCVTKTCDLATGMTKDADCAGFMTGCVYDGDVSCVDENSACTTFKQKSGASQCQNLTGKKGQEKCFDGVSPNCKARVCADAPNIIDSDLKCEAFLTGCLTTGAGCIESSAVCSIYSGTSTQCSGFKGNSITCQRTLACKTPTAVCANKKDATSNSQCMKYKSTCALTHGTTNCQDQVAACTEYTLNSSGSADKVTYCNTVLTTENVNCAYDPTTAGTCVARSCALWSISLGVACSSYQGPSSCSLANNICYTPTTCQSYVIPNSVSDKVTYCNKFQNTENQKCTFDQSVSATKCKTMNKCEEAISPTKQDDCYDQTKQSNCVLINSICVTIKSDCQGYDVSSGSDVTAKTNLCKILKSNNSGVIKQCKYSTGNFCGTQTCEGITGAKSQTDCDLIPDNCKYYASICYTVQACASYTIPSSATDNASKLKFCQNMYNIGGTDFCSFTDGATNCGMPKSCNEYIGLTPQTINTTQDNLNFCTAKRDKAGQVCEYFNMLTTCSDASDICQRIPEGLAKSNADCDLFTTPKACYISPIAEFCLENSLCKDSTAPSGKELSKCQTFTGPDGFYCSYSGSGTKCMISKDTCAGWSGSSVTVCSGYIDKYGNKCSWTAGTTCSDLTCSDAVSPSSQADCDLISSGCIFYNASCIRNSAACTDYTFPTSVNDNTKKFTYCNGRVTTGGDICTFTDSSTNCVTVAACSSYTAAGSTFTDKLTYCKSLLTTDNYDCIFMSGTKCQEAADLCTQYTVVTSADCASLKDILGRTCSVVGSATTCSYAACSSITSPTPAKQDDCDAVSLGCQYFANRCITPGTCASYAPGGSAITFCAGLRDTNGVQCFAEKDDDSNCKARDCADTVAKYFTTHKECQDYSPMCKSNGLGCVAISVDCSTNDGDSISCPYYLDATGQGKCVGIAATDTQACAPMMCNVNTTALIQQDCDNYIIGGGCRFINPGCAEKIIPCLAYRGTQIECSNFIGNGIKCYSDQAIRGACRDRICADKKIATSDDDCSSFLTGCVYNGVGCIDKTLDCTNFKGTNTTCSNFKGLNGAQLCWSSSVAVAACKIRVCNQLVRTSDSECEAFMPNSNCISDGTTCNQDTCSKFTASDGPCKANAVSNQAVNCTPRVCYEAPNNYSTDTQCKAFHPACVTNGRGCQSSVTCGDYQNQAACDANTLCLWATSCRITYTTCSSLTSQGQTVCVNNPGTKCAWFSGNGTPANAACRDYQCSDYDATLTTHDACQKASNKLCTTTGAGCVNYSTCSNYSTATMCTAAQTIELSKKCTWENAQCRQQQCRDHIGITDDECNTKLTGCKTNGSDCIGPTYSCSDFQSQKYCLIDSAGQPCLYVNGDCYSYDNCTDVTTPSRTTCAAFSSNCVQGTSTCIALNQCSKYTDQISCYSEISKTTCGWTLDQKCAEFKKCSDAAGTTWSDCQAWNSACVSDGTGCVPLGECNSYLKQLSCENNYDTNQKPCFWAASGCRLKECSDFTAITDADCAINIVNEGFCTSDGTKCLVRAACTAYSSQIACTVGSDGIPCFFGYAVGQTTGTQSCRVQECSDISGATNDACVGKINKKACVSNGKNCVAQGTCASYKNKFSCAAGGSDNPQCVFTAAPTATDPLAGTCIAFTSCASANGDKVTCQTNKSCKYTDASNKCETTDCVSFNGSGKCNPFPSFDGKTFTLCVSSTAGCAASDPSGIAQTDCWATTRYSYTWNSSTNKCASCKIGNNSTGSNVTNNETKTESEQVLRAAMILVLLILVA